MEGGRLGRDACMMNRDGCRRVYGCVLRCRGVLDSIACHECVCVLLCDTVG